LVSPPLVQESHPSAFLLALDSPLLAMVLEKSSHQYPVAAAHVVQISVVEFLRQISH
jgi:hypothetical protein